MPTSRALMVALTVALAATSCGSGTKLAAATPKPLTVQSSDGGLTLTVPPGATPRASEIAIKVLDTVPAELGSKKGTAYELTPDGLTFTKPVAVERRIDAKARGVDLRKGVPAVLLISKSQGKWAPLDNVEVRVDGGTIVVTGTTMHFSTVVAVNLGAAVSMTPGEVEKYVGEDFQAVATITEQGQSEVEIKRVALAAVGAVSLVGPGIFEPETYSSAKGDFTCTRTGSGEYRMTIALIEPGLGPFLAGQIPFGMSLSGSAACDPRPGPTSPAAPDLLEGGTLTVQHQEFGDYPSSGMWSFCFNPAVAGSGVLKLSVQGMNDGKPATAVISGGKAELRLGLRSYGVLRFTGAEVTSGGKHTDVLDEFQRYFGTPEVTSKQGVIAGNASDCK